MFKCLSARNITPLPASNTHKCHSKGHPLLSDMPFLNVLPLQWPYGDICGIGPVGKGQGTEFNLTFRKGSGKKSETLKFSTEHRMELLTEALVRPAAATHRPGASGRSHASSGPRTVTVAHTIPT